MSVALPAFDERVSLLQDFMDRVYQNEERIISAVVADGWSAEMARAGFALHRRTWDVCALMKSLDAELAPFGGVRALDRPARGYRIIAPKKIIHIWSALPGAGVTPTFYGWLLGAWQVVRSSRRSRHFASLFGELWLSTVGISSLVLEEGPKESWRSADVIVVSGTDETIDAVRAFIHDSGHRRAPIVVGYGHRISFAMIVDDGEMTTLEGYAIGLARDIVLWHQTGCFSPRAVLFCGTHERMEYFGGVLGDAIKDEEGVLHAAMLSDADLALRAQARGVSEFMNQVWGDGMGWVQRSREPFDGAQISAHTVSLHHVACLSDLSKALRIDARHIQGVALGVGDRPQVYRSWANELAMQGATRICAPGMMQAPDPNWAHDGWPNVLDWVRVCRIEALKR